MPVRSALVSVGYALPDKTITTADITQRVYDATGYEITNGLVERLTGVRSRRHRSQNEQSSDLAVRAAVQAMERTDVSVDQIDLLIFAACTQDITEPATANIVQEKLGATNAQVLDVKNACNSFLNGLDVADSHIRSGKSTCALVVCGETLSDGIDWDVKTFDDLKSRIAALTLGDAGAASILRAVPEEEERGIIATRFCSYGEKWRLATVLSGGSMHRLDENFGFFRSDSSQLREAAYEHLPNTVTEVLDSIGWKPTDIDVACGHQVTEELVHGIAKRCGIPTDRYVLTVTDCGNTAAASIPLTLARAYEQGMVKRGNKILLAGGAAGFSVGVITLIW